MRRHKGIGLLGMIAVIAAVAGGAAPAGAEATASTTVLTAPGDFVVGPITRARIEACLGEAVTFPPALVVVHVTEFANGFLFVFHANPQGGGVAVGESGTTYRVTAAGTLAQFFAPAGELFVFTRANSLRVFDPGGTAGWFGHLLMHVTVTPDGDITVLIDVDEGRCG